MVLLVSVVSSGRLLGPAVAMAQVAASAPLNKAECDGKSPGHIVRSYAVKGSPFTTIPLRCGTTNGFGLLKILTKHPETAATLDEDITRTLGDYDRAQQQAKTTVAYSKDDLPPCPGHFRVVVQYNSYGSTGIKGIITAFHSDEPAPGSLFAPIRVLC
ncbi:MAG: hypothetical protein ACT4QG_21595 [Sporichthyaceae bacterium]